MMELSGFKYIKAEPFREEEQPNCESHNGHPEQQATPTSEQHGDYPSYIKGDGIISTSLIFVISGGTDTEKNFLKVLINGAGIRSVRVLFLSKEGQGLMPYQQDQVWKQIQIDRSIRIDGHRYSLDDMDSVYLLTDVDEYYSQLCQIISRKAQTDSGRWIISNPCFEIWLYYCYLDNPERDLSDISSLTPDKLSQALKSRGHQLIAGGFNAIRSFDCIVEGIAHSRAHFTLDENRIPTLFSTQMHEFAEHILHLMEKVEREYSNYLKRKEEARKEFKSRLLIV